MQVWLHVQLVPSSTTGTVASLTISSMLCGLLMPSPVPIGVDHPALEVIR